MEESTYPCPACGFLVFGEPAGSYAICNICGWEDDHVQLRYPGLSGGANKSSLYVHQQGVLARLPLSSGAVEGCSRAPGWRPLRTEEVLVPGAPTSGIGYFNSAAEESPPYYWLADSGGVA
jgi:hypothetical protein